MGFVTVLYQFSLFYDLYCYYLEPGTVSFTKPSNIVKESCGKAEIEVERVNGADGKVELVWKTKDQSALHGKDYIGGEVIDTICLM